MKLTIYALTIPVMVALCLTAVQAADLTWDATPGGGIDDGGGTWLGAGQWNNGSPSATWNNSTPDNAIIGSGGNGGTISLGAVTAGSVTFNSFSGTYTLSGGTLSQSSGITVTSNSATATITTEVSGNGGITMSGPGMLTINNTANSYSGKTLVTDGVLQIGTGWQSSSAIPGGIAGNPSSGSNLELDGGVVTVWYAFHRTLGNGPGQLQLTGGSSGFVHKQYDRSGSTVLTSTGYEVVWGSDYFKPDVLVLNEEAASPNQAVNIRNKIDLNGADRTVACNSTKSITPGSGNGYMSTAGGRITYAIVNNAGTPAGLIKSGPGHLQLTAENTYDGDTTVNAGLLELQQPNPNNDSGNVTIADGAKLHLNFTGSDTVERLFIGTKTMRVGEFGHSSSGADNGGMGVGALDTHFENGSGKLITRLGPSGMVLLLL